ncbi:A/G-specific adenine glycosylase [Brotaphodocola sp.]|uniref:A/G-specific adenine glycosylase n=1 Tax=Brotaphodocola sp. TaxID=3073577 RepID=UPI003D7EA4E4
MDMYREEIEKQEELLAHLYDHIQTAESEKDPMTDEERLRAGVRPLLFWYEKNRRILPWREKPEPYRVWISEIMLQQTRVEAVKPYFERFMEALPTVADLAEVSDDRLMKLWEGLGYYSRARNLKKAAEEIMELHGGVIPADYQKLLKLPGIGSYTAGAIASIAFGIAVPAVDGNVLRVISRVMASREDILKPATRRHVEALVQAVIPSGCASEFNQGLIETGAIVCVPNGEPKCGLCPFESVCLAHRRNLVGEIPVKTPKKQRRVEERTVCILESGNHEIAIAKRPDQGLLAGLYELPNVEGQLKEEELAEIFDFDPQQVVSVEVLPKTKHIFSHVEWRMIGYRVALSGALPDRFLCAKRRELLEIYPLPGAFAGYTKEILRETGK